MGKIMIVAPEESGQQLIKYLLRKTDATKIFIHKNIRKKNIKVNKKKTDPKSPVESGDQIFLPDTIELKQNQQSRGKKKKTVSKPANNHIPMKILFEDRHLLAADKPAGIPVHGASTKKKSLLTMFSDTGHYPYLVPAHRIDQPTCGVLIFAKDYQTLKKLHQDFRDHSIIKIYHTLLNGEFDQPHFLTGKIIKQSGYAVTMNFQSSQDIPEKKEWLEQNSSDSAAIFHPLRTVKYKGQNLTETEIELWTGKYHQIRTFAKSFKHPVIGDRKYQVADSIGGKFPFILIHKRIIIPSTGKEIKSDYQIEQLISLD